VLRRLTPLVALCCAAALLFAATAGAADSIYWSNVGTETLGFAALSGEGGGTLTPTPISPEIPDGTAIDAATGKIYWANFGANPAEDSIGYSNLDGSGASLLNTAGASIEQPSGLAIYPAAGKIYWANEAGPSIAWANLDGTGGGTLDTTNAPFDDPSGVAIDPALNKIYWTNFDNTIGYANLDGSGEAGQLPIVGPQPERPNGLAIDAQQGRLYWVNRDVGRIGYANLDGTGAGLLAGAAAPASFRAGLAIDPLAGRIYWANEGENSIGFASLGGGSEGKVDITGTTPEGPAFPVLLEKPQAGFQPALGIGGLEAGANLSCSDVGWESDLVESFLYRAPQTISYAWTRDGEPIAGAGGRSLTATSAGTYTCETIGTNGAGSTPVPGIRYEVVAKPGPTASPGPTIVPATVKVNRIKYDRRRGSATVLAIVSGPGKLSLTGKNVVKDSVAASGAGVAKLKVAVKKGNGLRTLMKTGKVKVNFTIKFAATGGAKASASDSITLHRRPSA
jgi:DNA-binding beta-propeller fold protein YncE